jgi:hypothetical protein
MITGELGGEFEDTGAIACPVKREKTITLKDQVLQHEKTMSTVFVEHLVQLCLVT